MVRTLMYASTPFLSLPPSLPPSFQGRQRAGGLSPRQSVHPQIQTNLHSRSQWRRQTGLASELGKHYMFYSVVQGTAARTVKNFCSLSTVFVKIKLYPPTLLLLQALFLFFVILLYEHLYKFN